MNNIVKLNSFQSSTIKRLLMANIVLSTMKTWERNTYILKRKHKPLLARQNALKHRILKGKHFIYDLVEDTDERPPPDLKVVLTSFTEGIGDVGDVISGMSHYVRDSLLLPKKAVYATSENIDYYSKLKEGRPERPEFSSIYAGMTVRFLRKKVVPVFMNSEELWTLEPWHIKAAFRMEGIVVPEDAIKLPDTPITGPDPLKEDKDFAVFITINNTETLPVRCRLFQLDGDRGVQKLSEEFYLQKREPVLSEEQGELLETLPLPEIEDNSPEANISIKEKYGIKILN